MPKIRISFFKDGSMSVSGRTLTVSGLSPVFGRGRAKDEAGKVDRKLIADTMQTFTTHGKNARQYAGERRDGKEWLK